MSHLLVHLTASPFFGGPERQMLGLARALVEAASYCTAFLSFAEAGRCSEFLEHCRGAGFAADALAHDTPHLARATRELVERLDGLRPDALLVHGYKAGLVGRIAAGRLGIPVVAVSRGWTYASLKVNAYELLDRINLRWMDRVVCVSRGQARKVVRWGVPRRKVVVIPNAIDASRFGGPCPLARGVLLGLFPRPVRSVIGAAGRLSPEKGFDVLIDAAAEVSAREPHVGFVLFGDGPLREALTRRVAARRLDGRFVLAGFRTDLDRLLPNCDVFVQSSHTEGMPNVILEACAAGVPVVATAVGGTPEILADGQGGFLVRPGDPRALARRLLESLMPENHDALAARGRERVSREFTFERQARLYGSLFEGLCRREVERPSARRVAG